MRTAAVSALDVLAQGSDDAAREASQLGYNAVRALADTFSGNTAANGKARAKTLAHKLHSHATARTTERKHVSFTNSFALPKLPTNVERG